MARRRVRQAQRKLASAGAQVIANGVFQVAREIADVTPEGTLYWQAPFMFVAECVAALAIDQHENLGEVDREDLEAYFLAAMQEILTATFANLDLAYFRAWVAARDGVTTRETANE